MGTALPLVHHRRRLFVAAPEGAPQRQPAAAAAAARRRWNTVAQPDGFHNVVAVPRGFRRAAAAQSLAAPVRRLALGMPPGVRQKLRPVTVLVVGGGTHVAEAGPRLMIGANVEGGRSGRVGCHAAERPAAAAGLLRVPIIATLAGSAAPAAVG
jgi:hypothetical protein